MTCFPANPSLRRHGCRRLLNKIPQFHVNSTHESEPSSLSKGACSSKAVTRPRLLLGKALVRLWLLRFHVQRPDNTALAGGPYRTPPTPHSARHSLMRAKPMKLLGLNLAIPFAVRSGGCCFRLRCSGSRFTSLRGQT